MYEGDRCRVWRYKVIYIIFIYNNMETNMKSKSHEYIYKKILRDVKRYVSRKRNNSKLYYIDDDGWETEASFDFIPTRDEIEGLLIFLNKDKIPQA